MGASPPSAQEDVAGATLARVRDVTGDIVRAVRTAATQATDGWSLVSVLRPLVPELERVFTEREAFEREVAELTAQHEKRQLGWNAERAVLETELARERDQAQVLAEEVDRRRAEADLLTTRERRLREQMESIAARAHADREETLRLAREMVQSAEEARLAVVEEIDQVRAALAAAQASLAEIRQERAQATQGVAEREAELTRMRETIEQLEASRATAVAELGRARASLVQTESDLLAAQHEYQLAQVQIDKLCSAHDDLVEDRAQLIARLHDAKEREARLRLRITGLEQRVQAAHDGTVVAPAMPEESVEATTASELALELSRTQERARQLEGELVKARAAASAATVRVETLQEQLRATEQRRLAAESEIRALRARLVEPPPPASELEVVEVSPAGGSSAEHAERDPDVVGEAGNDAAPAGAAAEAVADEYPIAADPVTDQANTDADTSQAAPAHREEGDALPCQVAVIDATDAWSGDGAGAVHWFAPAPDAAERIRELDPACCVVNLAAPDALDVASAIRSADGALRLWGCVVQDEAAVALGPLVVVPRPIDPESVHTQLARLVSRGANVIMVGSESATLLPLRQGALLAGLSVRTAWNRAQAAELAQAVQPDVVIVDLACDPAAAAELVLDLARRDRPPLLVVVPAAPPKGADFVNALAAHTASLTGPVDRTALVRAAAAAVTP